MKHPKSKKKHKLPAALIPINHRAALRDLIDFDYLDQLSPSELKFLAKATDELYSGSFTGTPLHKKKAQRREIWADLQRSNDDVLGLGKNSRTIEWLDAPVEVEDGERLSGWELFSDTSERDWTPILETPEHKAAVAELKKQSPALPKRRNGKAQKTSPEFEAAKKKLINLNKAEARQRKK